MAEKKDYGSTCKIEQDGFGHQFYGESDNIACYILENCMLNVSVRQNKHKADRRKCIG